MGRLFETIRRLVADEKYVVGEHAAERLERNVESSSGKPTPDSMRVN
jgi:hypothetical protein